MSDRCSRTVYGVMSDRCRRQFTGSCRTDVAGQFTGSCRTDVARGCGGAPRGRLRECAMSDLYMILCITPPQTQIGVKIETYLRLKQRD
ncbi:unnamed protein product [Camellia sinensis]